VEELTPGEAQVLSIARAILRDPAVLVLIRPLAYVVPRQRALFRQLLRIWQMGGMPQIMDFFDEQGHAEAADEAAVPAAIASGGARTLVVTAEDMDPEPDARGVDSYAAADEFVDLGSMLELPEAVRAKARPHQSVLEDEETETETETETEDEEALIHARRQVRACC